MDKAVAKLAIHYKNELQAYRKGDDPLYCKHGTYVGDPYGPDYMCGPCEDGVTDYEMALYWAKEQFRSRAKAYMHDLVYRAIATDEFKALCEDDKATIAGELTALYMKF